LIPIGVCGFFYPMFFWPGWLLWAVLLLIFGMRHPPIYDPSDLGPRRRKLAVLALVIFLLSFTFAPIAYTGGF